MLKIVMLTAILSIPTFAAAIPVRPERTHRSAIFTASELNNLARLDETTQPANVRRMQTEIAELRDQVGRMKLDRLIDTVLIADAHTPRARLH